MDCAGAAEPPVAKASPPSARSAEPLAPLADLYVETSVAGTAFKDDQNRYVTETGWERTFRRRPFWHALRQASYVPAKVAVPFQLTDPLDLDFNLESAYFTSKEEATLGIILRTQDRLIQRCKATFDTTPSPSSTGSYRSIRASATTRHFVALEPGNPELLCRLLEASALLPFPGYTA